MLTLTLGICLISVLGLAAADLYVEAMQPEELAKMGVELNR